MFYRGKKKQKPERSSSREKCATQPLVSVLLGVSEELEKKKENIKKKNKKIEENIVHINHYESQIKGIIPKIAKKKEEHRLLQEKIKQKRKRKKEVTDIIESYLQFIQNNDKFIKKEMDSLTKKEILLLKKEKALKAILTKSNIPYKFTIDPGAQLRKQSLNGGRKTNREKINNFIKQKEETPNNNIPSTKKPSKSKSVERLSSTYSQPSTSCASSTLTPKKLKKLNTIKEKFEEDEIEEKFKKNPPIPNAASKMSTISKIATEENQRSNGISLEVQRIDTSKLYRNKNLNSSRERLKKFLINESHHTLNSDSFNIDELDNIRLFPSHFNTMVVKKIRKSNSDVELKKKSVNDTTSNFSQITRIIEKRHSSTSLPEDNDILFMLQNEEKYLRQKKSKERYRKLSHVLIKQITRAAQHFIFYFLRVNETIDFTQIIAMINKKIIVMLKKVLSSSSKVYNEGMLKRRMSEEVLVNIDDIIEFKSAHSYEEDYLLEYQSDIGIYKENLGKMDAILKETKKIEKSMKEIVNKMMI